MKRYWKPILSLVLFFSLLGPSVLAEVRYDAEDKRDPFFGVNDAAPVPVVYDEGTEQWEFEGFLSSPTISYAKINGQVVKVGDRIRDAEVLSIDKKGVRLRRNGRAGYLTKQGIQWT